MTQGCARSSCGVGRRLASCVSAASTNERAAGEIDGGNSCMRNARMSAIVPACMAPSMFLPRTAHTAHVALLPRAMRTTAALTDRAVPVGKCSPRVAAGGVRTLSLENQGRQPHRASYTVTPNAHTSTGRPNPSAFSSAAR